MFLKLFRNWFRKYSWLFLCDCVQIFNRDRNRTNTDGVVFRTHAISNDSVVCFRQDFSEIVPLMRSGNRLQEIKFCWFKSSSGHPNRLAIKIYNRSDLIKVCFTWRASCFEAYLAQFRNRNRGLKRTPNIFLDFCRVALISSHVYPQVLAIRTKNVQDLRIVTWIT